MEQIKHAKSFVRRKQKMVKYLKWSTERGKPSASNLLIL